MTDKAFSTQQITPQLIAQVIDALRNKAFGSVEIYIQNYKVVQITERTITKVTTKIQTSEQLIKNERPKSQFPHESENSALSDSTNS